MDKALVEKTKKVLESISAMESIRPYVLVGGTALAMQIGHRLSEDLDFMRWQTHKTERMEIDISSIQKELASLHSIETLNILEFNHIEFFIDGGVKLSFYAPQKRNQFLKTVPYKNNLVLADINSIASLKMETMMRRTVFRDYYDLYCILNKKSPEEIRSIINNALKYSGHQLKSKNLLGMLVNADRFKYDSSFHQLEPEYNVTAKDIEGFMMGVVKNVFEIETL